MLHLPSSPRSPSGALSLDPTGGTSVSQSSSGSLPLYLLFYCYCLFFNWQINSVLFCSSPSHIYATGHGHGRPQAWTGGLTCAPEKANIAIVNIVYNIQYINIIMLYLNKLPCHFMPTYYRRLATLATFHNP